MPFAAQFPATAALAEPLTAHHRHTLLHEEALQDSINLGLELKKFCALRSGEGSAVRHPTLLAGLDHHLTQCLANFDYRQNDAYARPPVDCPRQVRPG